ncbi:MAG: hypothetical protein ACHQQQ_02720 [Bacteroidota bacterium]
MQNIEEKIREIVLKTLVSVLCCAILGYIFYRGDLFNRSLHHFDFIAFGIIGSVFFHTLRFSVRNAFAVLLSAALIVTVLLERAHGRYALGIVLNTVTSALAIYLFFIFIYNSQGKKKLVELLNLALLFAVLNLFANLLIVLIFGNPQRISALWTLQWIRHWFLIGLGIGVGIVVTEKSIPEKLRTSYRDFIHWITFSEKSD